MQNFNSQPDSQSSCGNDSKEVTPLRAYIGSPQDNFVDNAEKRSSDRKIALRSGQISDEKIDNPLDTLLFKEALDAMERDDYNDAIECFERFFSYLYLKENRGKSDVANMAGTIVFLTNCYDNLKEPYKAVESLSEKRDIFINQLKRDDYAVVVSLAMFACALDALASCEITTEQKKFLLDTINDVSNFINNTKLSKGSDYALVVNSLEFFYAKAMKCNEVIVKEKLTDICANIFYAVCYNSKGIPNLDKATIHDRWYDFKVFLAIKKESVDFLQALLEQHMKSNQPISTAKIIIPLLNIYAKHGNFDEIKALFYEPYLYVLEKLKNAPKVTRSQVLLDSFYKLTVQAFYFYSKYAHDYSRAESYILQLRKVMESHRGTKILGYDFSKVIEGNTKTIKRLLDRNPNLIIEYLSLLDDAVDISKRHEFDSCFKQNSEISKIRNSFSILLSVLKKVNPEDYLNLILDKALDYIKSEDSWSARKYLKMVKDFGVKDRSFEVSVKYLSTKIWYYSSFVNPNDEERTPKLFKKIHDMYITLNKEYDDDFYNVLLLTIDYYIDRDEGFKALETLALLEEYIEQNNLQVSDDQLLYFNYKLEIYKSLGMQEQYREVKKKRKKLKKQLGDSDL